MIHTPVSQLCALYYEALLQELQQAGDRFATDVLQQARQSSVICRAYLLQLKKLVRRHRFMNKAEEIEFFKTLKPPFTARLMYYSKLFSLHAGWPAGSEQAQQQYIESQLQQLNQFFHIHQAFYHYYRGGYTNLDGIYFTRGNEHLQVMPGFIHTDADPSFSTGYDYLVACILCNDLLQQYLQTIKALPAPNSITGKNSPPSPLQWSGQKAELAELVYALHIQGVFNFGRISVNEIAGFLAGIFKVSSFDCYRTYCELRRRKNGRTKFLDKLREDLQSYMEGQD